MAGFATLDADEAQRLAVANPELLSESDASERVVAVVTADDRNEMAALAGVVAAVRAAFRVEHDSLDAIMRTLLPEERLTVGGGLMAQARRNAELRAGLAEEFGLLSAADVAQLARSRAANERALASRWRSQGQIFAVLAEQTLRFPGFQFDEEGRPLAVVRTVIERLEPALGAWELALWFVGPNSWLGGERPVDVLSDSADEVAHAASMLAAELGDEASGRGAEEGSL